jgi:hypothetical protein
MIKYFIILVFLCLFSIFSNNAFCTVYYVDPSGSNTAPFDTWAKAATTLGGVVESRNMVAGDVVYLRGTTVENYVYFNSLDSGDSIHPGEEADDTIAGDLLETEPVSVSGSNVTFTTTPALNLTYLNGEEYYVWIINSFSGNSGVFLVTGINGKVVTVDTSDLPNNEFITEDSGDGPWTMRGAIIRPVRIIGCNASGVPRNEWPTTAVVKNNGSSWGFGLEFSGVKNIYISYIKTTGAKNYGIMANKDVDFLALDHVEVFDAGNIQVGFNEDEHGSGTYHQFGNVMQHCKISRVADCLHDFGDATMEMFYNGGETSSCANCRFQFFSLMYSEITGANGCANNTRVDAEWWDGRGNHDYITLWGNSFHDNYGGNYGGVSIGAGNYLVANNFIYDNRVGTAASSGGDTNCPIMVKFAHGFGSEAYIFNNIVYNNTTNGNAPGGICFGWDGDNSGVHVMNNVFYGAGDNAYSGMQSSFQSATIGFFYNNIFQNFATIAKTYGGRMMTWNNSETNLYFDYNSLGTYIPGGSYLTDNPEFTDPIGHNFSIGATSPAKDKGTVLSNFFHIDFQHAERDASCDIGAYEYLENIIDSSPPAIPSNFRITEIQ